jgi:hypothetical protein
MAEILNVRGIVDLDQIAKVITSLVDQVNRQNIVISDLKTALSQCVTHDVLEENIVLAYSNMNRLGERLDKVQEACTAEISEKR